MLEEEELEAKESPPEVFIIGRVGFMKDVFSVTSSRCDYHSAHVSMAIYNNYYEHVPLTVLHICTVTAQ